MASRRQSQKYKPGLLKSNPGLFYLFLLCVKIEISDLSGNPVSFTSKILHIQNLTTSHTLAATISRLNYCNSLVTDPLHLPLPCRLLSTQPPTDVLFLKLEVMSCVCFKPCGGFPSFTVVQKATPTPFTGLIP